MNAYEIRGVSYFYNRTPALADLSLTVLPGERLALLGANGSGKSTLLRVLAGLSFPHRGTVSFFGEDLTEARLQDDEFFFRFRRRAGIVFQNPDIQLFNPSVFDELAFGPLQLGLPKPEVRRRVEETLERFHLAHLRDRAPHRLSGGEKKRVALASVLILDPDVLLLDEPAAALDPASQSLIVDLYSAWSGGAKTVVTATHDLDTLEEIAGRCLVLENGRLAAEGAPLAILHDVALLERTRLIRPHRHVHESGGVQPHPHIHRH